MQDSITKRYRGIFILLFNKTFEFLSYFIICDGKDIYQNLNSEIQNKSKIIANGIDFEDFIRDNELGKKFRKSNK